MTTTKRPPAAFPEPGQVRDLLWQVLKTSPADFTELVWMGRMRRRAATRAKVEPSVEARQVVLLRVVEQGRVGFQRLARVDVPDLQMAVRQALAHARAEPALSPQLPKNTAAEKSAQALGTGHLFDKRLAGLRPDRVNSLLDDHLGRRQTAILDWTQGSLVVANSEGLDRRVDATCASLRVVSGRGPHAGLAAASGRTLNALDPAAVVARARRREAEGTVEQPVPPVAPLVLSPEVVTVLVSQLNHWALTSRSFLDGRSPLMEQVGETCFDPHLQLWDDGADQDGLPFPCDVRGRGKGRNRIVVSGRFDGPAINDELAKQLDRPATAHAVDIDEARFCHLFVGRGKRAEKELVADLEDGYYVSSLARIEILPEQGRLPFRARLRGVRHIRDGHLAEALPELLWQDDLLRLLRKVEEVSRESVSLAWGDGFLGGITAPAMRVVAQGLGSC